jgi:ATP-binding cassette, subfamily B, bacterial
MASSSTSETPDTSTPPRTPPRTSPRRRRAASANSPPTARATRRRALRLFRPYRRQLWIIALTAVGAAGLGTIQPLLIPPIFDRALFVSGGPRLGLLAWLVGAMAALSVASGAFGLYQTFLTNVIGQRVMRDLRDRLYGHLQGMPLRFFTGTRTGDIQSRLANDVGGLQTVVTEAASSVLSSTVVVVGALVAMTVISPLLTLLTLLLLPVFFWLTVIVGRARRRVATETQEALATMSTVTEETLSVSGVLLAKVFGRQSAEATRYAKENERLARLQISQQLIGRAFFTVIQTFFALTPALVYLLAGLVLHRGGGLTAGQLVAFTTLQTRLFFPVAQVLEIGTQVSGSLALFGRIFSYLDLDPDIIDGPGALHLTPNQVRGEVALDRVSFRYESSPGTSFEEPGNEAPRMALNELSLHVPAGKLAAIVGPSGAGKTTISYLIPRLYDTTEGRVLLDGIDVRSVALDSLAQIIGMVTQESYLFHASIRDNLAYARPGASDADIEAAARAAHIHERIMEFDDGYHTVVGERGYRLSGGEKQRIAIGRVLLRDPKILILDEATSALDTVSERIVQSALESLTRGRTTIAIAHRLSTIRSADIIFVVDQGRVVETGDHDTLLRQGGVYARLYDEQFGGGTVEARCADGVVLTRDADRATARG